MTSLTTTDYDCLMAKAVTNGSKYVNPEINLECSVEEDSNVGFYCNDSLEYQNNVGSV
jgi:hypothetical protein